MRIQFTRESVRVLRFDGSWPDYLVEELEHYSTRKALTIIQQQLHDKLNKCKTNPASGAEDMAVTLEKKIKDFTALVDNYIRTTIDPKEKFAKLISYKQFTQSLRRSFYDTLTKIQRSLNSNYVIIGDQDGKSTNWVIAHLHDMMEIHPPENIILPKEVGKFFEDHPNIEHIITIDDAAYSGQQMSSTVSYVAGIFKKQFPQRDVSIHVTIPYMTTTAIHRIEEGVADISSGVIKLKFSTYQLMQTNRELYQRGYYNYTKENRFDLNNLRQLFQELTIFIELETSDFPERAILKDHLTQLNQVLLKPPIFKKHNMNIQYSKNGYKAVKKKLVQLENTIEKLLEKYKEVNKELYITLSGVLQKISKQEEIQMTHKLPTLPPSGDEDVFDEGSPFANPDHTQTWFDHKSADALSAHGPSMKQRTDGKEATEPYKESYEKQQERTQQVNTLMSMTPVNCQLHRKPELRWLIDHNVRLIFNVKDFFILGNNYESIYEGFYDEADSDLDSDLEPEDKKPTLLSGDQQVQKPTLLNDDHQVKFCVEHESFPLGGQTGAYMFKLKINQTFTVSDNDGNSVTLTIVDDQKGAFRLKNKIE